MRYQTVGTSDLRVSIIGLGGSNFGRELGALESKNVIDAAIDCGVNLIDTADIYGGTEPSEEVLGRVLGSNRDKVILATKFGNQKVHRPDLPAHVGKASPVYIRGALDASLRRLRTDYIDLYQLHMPDPLTPIDETLAELSAAVEAGKVRHIGHSNFSAQQLVEADSAARSGGYARFVACQSQWSLVDRSVEREILGAALAHGIGVLAYRPLANGLLTGKVRRGMPLPDGTRISRRPETVTQQRVELVEHLVDWASQRGRTVLDVAIGALASIAGCASVIAGATSTRQVRENCAAAEWCPNTQEVMELAKLTERC